MAKTKPTFSDEIRHAVDAAGLTQAEVARQLDVSRNLVSAFMRGGGLSFAVLDSLAALLGLRVITETDLVELKHRRGNLND